MSTAILKFFGTNSSAISAIIYKNIDALHKWLQGTAKWCQQTCNAFAGIFYYKVVVAAWHSMMEVLE